MTSEGSGSGLPSLVEQMRNGMSRYVSWAIFTIGLIGASLHTAWSVHQQSVLQQRVRDAIAYTLQESVRNHDWIAIKRTLQAFSLANDEAVICVRLPDGIILEQPNCYSPSFRMYTVPLTGDSFLVSVKLPLLGKMALAGIPFLLATLILVLLISRYLRILSQKTTSDLKSLFRSDPEVTMFFDELSDARGKIIEGLRLQYEREKLQVEAAIGAMATQTAHDIRSPLAALDMMVSDLSQLSADKRVIIRNAIARINAIANDLLQGRGSQGVLREDRLLGLQKATSCQLLSSLAESLIIEKRMQFRANAGIDIRFHMGKSAYNSFVDVQPAELNRVISNLINNSVEALGDRGVVELSLECEENIAILKVSDNGKGIPAEILPKLMQKGESFGKTGGSGLGLYHAKTCIENSGGSIAICSAAGSGTLITLSLPLKAPPSWFIPELRIVPNGTIVILDGDSSMHRIWDRRLGGFADNNRKLPFKVAHLYTSADLEEWLASAKDELEFAVFLVAYEFQGGSRNGLQLIEASGISSNCILVTGRDQEDEVLNECLRLGVRLIPKSIVEYVPITLVEPRKKKDVLLIDDDLLVHSIWKMAAKQTGKLFEGFTEPMAFFDKIDVYDRTTPVYIDSCLGSGVKGEEIAKKVYEAGFTSVYLATGYHADSFSEMPWIKAVVGKEPPRHVTAEKSSALLGENVLG